MAGSRIHKRELPSWPVLSFPAVSSELLGDVCSGTTIFLWAPAEHTFSASGCCQASVRGSNLVWHEPRLRSGPGRGPLFNFLVEHSLRLFHPSHSHLSLFFTYCILDHQFLPLMLLTKPVGTGVTLGRMWRTLKMLCCGAVIPIPSPYEARGEPRGLALCRNSGATESTLTHTQITGSMGVHSCIQQ